MLLPVPIRFFPQLPEYHLQFAKLPREPPPTDSVTGTLPQIESAEAVTETGSILGVFTLMVFDAQDVVLQVPSALTKYCAVAVGVMERLVPVARRLPPQLLLYHFHTALEPKDPEVICIVTALFPQVESLFVIIFTAGVEGVLIFMVFVTIPVMLHVPSALTEYVEAPATGVTVMELPVPICVQHVPLIHTHFALLPKLPPETVRVTLVEPHVESAVDNIVVAATLKVFTFIGLIWQADTLQVPSALT